MTPTYTQTTSDIDSVDKRCNEAKAYLDKAFFDYGLGKYDDAARHMHDASFELRSAANKAGEIADSIQRQKGL